MSDLARYLAGDNYLTRSASGIKRGLSALADSLTARSNEGIENMGAALSGVRVMPGAILTDAGYVMPDASGQPDFTQVGLEREPDTMRLLELFGSAMTPVKGASLAAKSGAGGKVAADVARALPMDEASRMARAADMGFGGDLYHATSRDFPAFSLAESGTGANAGRREGAVFLTDSPAVADTYLGGAFVDMAAPAIQSHGAADLGGGVGRVYQEGSQVIPSRVRGMEDFDVWDMFGGAYDPSTMKQALRDAKKDGVPGVVFQNMRDPGQMSMGRPKSSTVVAVLDPSRIRSRFAAFDPSRADEADLLASSANLGPIVNALLQGYDRR